MNLVKLEDRLSESWPDYTLVERQIKVELYDEQVKDVSFEEKETLVLSPKSTAYTEGSVSSSIEKNKFQPQLVMLIGGLPVKAEENINADQLTEFSSDSDRYLTEDCQLKTYIKLEPTSSKGEAGKLLFSKLGEKTINEDFLETKLLTQEEFDIKSEEEESDQSNIKPAKGETEKLRHRNNKSDSLNGFNLINTSSHQLHLDEPLVFSCSNCSYQTHQQRNLNRHVAKHMEMKFKCPHCPYQTCYSSGLKRHKLVHASKEEVELHKCPECPFTSKWKKAVTKHLLMHKSFNEVTWYQCPDCPFKTKHKRNLINRHMFIHRREVGHENPDKWFSCPLCPFKTPYRSAVNKHALVHKSESDIEWFQCSECSFKAKRKSNFNQHKLIHNQVEKQFECSECCYKTAIAAYYRRHLLKHKDPDSETWFRCFHCTYKTTQKSDLRKHTNTHKLK